MCPHRVVCWLLVGHATTARGTLLPVVVMLSSKMGSLERSRGDSSWSVGRCFVISSPPFQYLSSCKKHSGCPPAHRSQAQYPPSFTEMRSWFFSKHFSSIRGVISGDFEMFGMRWEAKYFLQSGAMSVRGFFSRENFCTHATAADGFLCLTL